MGRDDGLFDNHPGALVASMAAGAGVIALATLAVEIATGARPAQMLGLGRGFVSLPLGVATLVLAVLAARSNRRYALPGLVFGLAYCVIAMIAW